jgi:hypothetical protein
MKRREAHKQRVAQVAEELRSVIGRQVRSEWSDVRMAERNEGGHHVWRFRTESDLKDRFLHIDHRAMVSGRDATARLTEQLTSSPWAERLRGPETALLLTREGQMTSHARA